jgi:hypothetical protein
VASRLDKDRETILEQHGPLTTDEAARLLGTTRPTVLSWTKRGVLDRHWRSTPFRGLVTAASVAAILPAIREWNDNGRDGRALRKILERMRDDLDTELSEKVSRARTVNGRAAIAPGAIGPSSVRRGAAARRKIA